MFTDVAITEEARDCASPVAILLRSWTCIEMNKM